MHKSEAISAILNKLREKKAELVEACASTRQEANDAPTAMQSHSDTTRSQMQTQLTDLERMLTETNYALASISSYTDHSSREYVELGSLVALEYDQQAKWYLLTEFGGGVATDIGPEQITLVTLSAPLGQGLLHRLVGDSVMVGKSNYIVREIQ